MEEEVIREVLPGRRGVWDTRVLPWYQRDLCSQVLSVTDREILVRKWKGQLGGLRMDADFENWLRVMRKKKKRQR
jgi:hypothetical protein